MTFAGAGRYTAWAILLITTLYRASPLEGQAPPSLVGARFDVVATAEGVSVRARFDGHDGPLALTLIRFPDVEVELVSGGGSLVVQDGLIRMAAVGGDIRYRVRGAPYRIPLPVPEIPVVGGPEAVRIELEGFRPSRGAFPRLVERDGGASASLADVPAFVMIPPTRFGLSYKDLFDAVVVLLIGAATGLWIRGQVVARREA